MATTRPDPLSPALYCDSAVIAQFNRAWQDTTNGRAGEGTQESGFRIDWTDNHLVIGDVEMGTIPFRVSLTTTSDTIAIVHVHPNGGIWTPSDIDMNEIRFPDYVLSGTGMNVTLPGKHAYKFLRPFLSWSTTKGCR